MEISDYRERIDEAANNIEKVVVEVPTIGIILGTGLGQLAEEIEIENELLYDDLEHFPEATVEMHEGRLIFGTLNGTRVMAMQGRYHLYEGYSPKEVTLPVRVMGELGVNTLFVSNAAGGMNTHFAKGDVMLVTDHINLQGQNPLEGPNVEDWGPRFPDMSEPYDEALRDEAKEIALGERINLHEGVYVAVEGPNLETRAEYRMLRQLGADVVGMSTVPEVIVANHMGMRVMCLSAITDLCFPDALEPIDIEDVMASAAKAEPKMTKIIRQLIGSL